MIDSDKSSYRIRANMEAALATRFAIEKDVPVPSDIRGRRTLYPLGEMEVGDSFFVQQSSAQSVRISICTYGRRHNKKFVTRTVDGGVRVWRIA